MEEWKMASISARRAKEILPGEEEMPEKRKNSMKIVPRGTPCACAEWKASTAPEESRGEEESRRRQSKGTDHALRRLGSGEFASASSPHLASSITNISTGPCPSPPSLLSAPSSSFTSSTGDPRFTWSLWRSSTREHATLPTTLDALHALAFHALIRDIPMRLQSRETLATSIDEYRQFSNVLSRKMTFAGNTDEMVEFWGLRLDISSLRIQTNSLDARISFVKALRKDQQLTKLVSERRIPFAEYVGIAVRYQMIGI